jgi:flagellar secretion chaperone FliS
VSIKQLQQYHYDALNNLEKDDKDMNASLAMQQYRHNHIQGGVDVASPHRLVQMLMEGALEKIMAAKGFMATNEIAKKGEHISWAISIIDSLRSCLNVELGGEVAQNLADLYNYIEQRLLEANIQNDPTILDEVGQLIIQIKSGWDQIPEEYHHTS